MTETMTEKQFNKEVNSSSKSLIFLWVTTLVLFLASTAVILGLWMSFKNDRIKTNLAILDSAESGEVMGTTTKDPNYLINLAENLKAKGIIVYGFDNNQETKRQLAIFGQAVTSIDYVECNSQSAHSNADECVARVIDQYPTWVEGEQKFVGYKTLEDLEKILSNQ
ncbi:MAG: hypothetical protein NTY30_04520 [Candidatus Berkelbacteria bacterium]|nr:hypothetical protein [Candidatus Berkelbacteria bacterium]